jgi:hypothetical protein
VSERNAALEDERPLDRHLAERLSEFFGGAVTVESLLASPADLRGALMLRQYDGLCRTLSHARSESAHYRKKLKMLFPDTGNNQRGCPVREPSRLSDGTAVSYGRRLARPARDGGQFPDAAAYRDVEKSLYRLLEMLPFTLPREAAAAPEAFLAVPHDAVAGVISLPTSGTSGLSKRIFCTGADMEETVAFFEHGMSAMVRPGRGDHVALLMSGEREGSVGALLRQAMRKLGVACTILGYPVEEDATMEALVACRPTCLVGVPGHIFSLARHPRAGELAPHLRTVLLSGDAVAASLREGIEAAFGQAGGCSVFVHYGLTETGLGGAVECSFRCGCHVREGELLIEIIDAAGFPAAEGAWGEIVITTLTREAMPLIRYRTGDSGRFLAGPCACGSVLRRLEARGRLDQCIALPLDLSHACRPSLPAGGGAAARRENFPPKGENLLYLVDLDQCLYALPWIRDYYAVLYVSAHNRRWPPIDSVPADRDRPACPFPEGRGDRKSAPGLAGSQSAISPKGEVPDHKENFDEGGPRREVVHNEERLRREPGRAGRSEAAVSPHCAGAEAEAGAGDADIPACLVLCLYTVAGFPAGAEALGAALSQAEQALSGIAGLYPAQSGSGPSVAPAGGLAFLVRLEYGATGKNADPAALRLKKTLERRKETVPAGNSVRDFSRFF